MEALVKFEPPVLRPTLLRKDHKNDPRVVTIKNDQAFHFICQAEMIILPSTAYGYEKGTVILVECSKCRYRASLDKHRLYDLGLLGGRT